MERLFKNKHKLKTNNCTCFCLNCDFYSSMLAIEIMVSGCKDVFETSILHIIDINNYNIASIFKKSFKMTISNGKTSMMLSLFDKAK